MNDIKSIMREYFHQPYEEKIKIKLSAATGYRFVPVVILNGYNFDTFILTNGRLCMLNAEDIKELERI